MKFQKKLAAVIILSSMAAFMSHSALAADAPSGTEAKSDYVKPNLKHDPYGELNIIVPLTSDDKGIQGMKLRNITNGLISAGEWKGEMNVAVVIYAKGTSLLKNPDEKFQKQMDELRAKGVRFLVCNNSLREQGLDYHNLYNVKEADIVPSGFAEVAFLQAKKHYVVDPSF
jgi:intracellular sulfur oxidation DsrE/DsrF family protein